MQAGGPGTAERIIADFAGIGAVQRVDRIASGLMHETYAVDTDADRYILQRLHPKLSTPEIVGDFEAVTAHLAAKGIEAPRLLRTREGRPVAVDEVGRWWRLTTRIPGDTRDRVATVEEAEEGARALGRFHRAIADIAHRFASQHPLHDTPGHLANLRAAAANPAFAEPKREVAAEIEEILARLPPLVLPANLPVRVVHGDPKISNVLFDGGRAVGLIDLDTCNRHSVLVDLGDAVRSWCRDGAEDERERFHLDRFEGILRGYAAEGLPLTGPERNLLGRAGRLITLELASRFARDVLEDAYFAYDAARYPDRRSHNRARTRSMLYLAADMAARQAEIDALVADYFGD